MIVWPAFAKVNLALEVLGRRPDGYHEIVSVMQTVDLHDTVAVAPAAALTFTCSDPALAGPDNLALRAAVALRQSAAPGRGAAIDLDKRVPVAAGLGGGSSDAAATLLALDRLWELHLSAPRLNELAATLGADVPFFLHGGTALVGGRGERIEPLPAAPERWLVLVRPPDSVPGKTALLYGRLTPADYGDGSATRAAAEALRRGEFPADEVLVNTFARVADGAFPGLAAARADLEAAAGRPAHLSGAGPTLFAVFTAPRPAEDALCRLQAKGREAYLVRTGPWRPQPCPVVNVDCEGTGGVTLSSPQYHFYDP